MKQCAGARCCLRSHCSGTPHPTTLDCVCSQSRFTTSACILGARALAPPWVSRGYQPPACIFCGALCVFQYWLLPVAWVP